MPRRTITPADEGIQAAQEERSAALEQATEQEQSAQIPETQADASNPESTAPALPMKIDVRITSTRNA